MTETDHPTAEPHLLEVDTFNLTVRERLLKAAMRIESGESRCPFALALRVEQVGCCADLRDYLTDVATQPEDLTDVATQAENPDEIKMPFGRIVQPPRTGKTVIAGYAIAATGLMTTIIVPTKTLVDQTVAELHKQLPGVPVGILTGESKETVIHGVNVITYQSLQRQWKKGDLPMVIRASALVICDEAHLCMTRSRQDPVRNAFDPMALRIGLTATPDWNEKRRLAEHFPDLIHEITLAEAVELDLLAPLRVWVAEVDETASNVELIAGDFDEEKIGRLMSSAPFFEAAMEFRYRFENKGRPALICCSTRQQAYDLWMFLRSRRPAGTNAPKLILGDTPSDERKNILEYFEAGVYDTIVNVGVLLTGWNSPMCKLLIDLAPTVSRVRATQKFFRPMTRNNDEEAHVYMILPKDLPQLPIFPMELFGPSLESYECGDLIASRMAEKRAAAIPTAIKRQPYTPIKRVEARTQIKLAIKAETPRLDPRNRAEIRSVLASNLAFSPETARRLSRFRWILFQHPLFTGRGEQLLRYTGIPVTQPGFDLFMAGLYPEEMASRLMRREDVGAEQTDVETDLAAFFQEFNSGSAGITDHVREEFAKTIRAITGQDPDDETDDDFDRLMILHELYVMLDQTMSTKLSWREDQVLRLYYGLVEGQPKTCVEIGEQFNCSGTRINQILRHARHKLRERLLFKNIGTEDCPL